MNGDRVTGAWNEHVGDDAELYALGALDAADARRVNEHAAACVACALLVGEAERAVTALDLATVPMLAPPPELAARIAATGATPLSFRSSKARPSRTVLSWGALAACVALVVAGAGGRTVAHLRDIAAQDDAALATIANAHFKHATLSKSDPSAPTAKALWGISRRWIYVVVDSPACACTVVVRTDAGDRDLGAPLARGATAVTFATDLPEVRAVEIRKNGRSIETAALP